MDDRSTDIFGPVKGNSDDSEEEEEEEEPEEEQEKDQISSIFEEEGEVEEDKPDYDPWRPLRQKVGQDLKELYWNKVQQFLDRGKSQTYADNAAFNALLPVWRGRLRKSYLERLKWIHRIILDTVHRKVMKTLRRFIDEDDMDFDEAAESAVEKRKFLLNRVVKEKLLPAESDDDEEAEEEVEAPVSYSESTT